MRLRGYISILLSIVILAMLSYFSWPPTITGFAGFTAGTEANLTIWDETDNESFEYANQTRFPGDIVFFFANYTNATDGTILNDTIANCSINFSTDPTLYSMDFNATKLLWEFNATFSSSNPNYNFSVNCSAPGTDYDNLTATDNFTISDNITPSLVVSSPVNGTLYGTTLIDLNFTATDDYLIDTCWYTNVNGTNITLAGCANTTITANEGANNITVYVNDTSNNINSTEIFFSVDITEPSITLINPVNGSVFYTDNISLEYTTTDANLDECWYELSNSSTYNLPGCANTTIVLPQGDWALKVWANDTIGNTNSTPFSNFTIWTQFVTVCSSGCNFTNINDALTYVNGSAMSVLVNESGIYELNNSYYVTGGINLSVNSSVFSADEAPCAIILLKGPVDLNCNNNWIIGNGIGGVICVENLSGSTVERCRIKDVESGIFFNFINGGTIRENEIRNMTSGGMSVFDSTDTEIYNNTIENITSGLPFAMLFIESTNILVANNSCRNGGIIGTQGASGAYGDFDNLTFVNNNLNNCAFGAFSAEYLKYSNNSVRNVDTAYYFTNIISFGIANILGNITSIEVTNSFIDNVSTGVYYSGVYGGIIANNTIKNSNISYYLDVSQNILVENNSFSALYGGMIINSTP